VKAIHRFIIFDCPCPISYLDFVHFLPASPQRTAGKFFSSSLINSAFGYEFREELKNLQSASYRSARQKMYKVELTSNKNVPGNVKKRQAVIFIGRKSEHALQYQAFT